MITVAKRKVLSANAGRYNILGSHQQGELGAKYTGRCIIVGPNSNRAKRWVESYEEFPTPKPYFEQELLDCLSRGVVDDVVYRGRTFKGIPKSFLEFGPPPPDKAKRERYNDNGVPVHYLCSSREGIKSEFLTIPDGERLWIQRFRIKPTAILADAQKLMADSFAAAVFWFIEHGRDRDHRPLLGPRIGDLVRFEYDGLLVPGVRGNDSQLYFNIVLLSPGDCWMQFLIHDGSPEMVCI
jgi:hypothetical protein